MNTVPHYIIEENLRCFKCGSTRVGPLFLASDDPLLMQSAATGREIDIDSDFYHIHHDCLCCYDCKAWDFPEPEQWHSPVVIGGFTCECGGTRLAVTENDIFQDTFEVKCLTCGKEQELQKEPAGSEEES